MKTDPTVFATRCSSDRCNSKLISTCSSDMPAELTTRAMLPGVLAANRRRADVVLRRFSIGLPSTHTQAVSESGSNAWWKLRACMATRCSEPVCTLCGRYEAGAAPSTSAPGINNSSDEWADPSSFPPLDSLCSIPLP